MQKLIKPQNKLELSTFNSFRIEENTYNKEYIIWGYSLIEKKWIVLGSYNTKEDAEFVFYKIYHCDKYIMPEKNIEIKKNRDQYKKKLFINTIFDIVLGIIFLVVFLTSVVLLSFYFV